MALKVYKKADIQIRSVNAASPNAEKTAKTSRQKSTIRQKTARGVRVFSGILIAVGAGVLGLTLWPYVSYYAGKLFTQEENPILSAGENGAVLAVDSRFSTHYFDNVEESIAKLSEELAGQNEDFSKLEGEFYLTVPKIGIDNAPVKLNVDSFNETEYLKVLRSKFAHFQGSSIPGKTGTTFVYGHSTSEWYARAHRDYFPSLFTFLTDLSIGDEIFVEYNGIKHTYTVTRIHEVPPSDLSPVFEKTNKKILKLMTCSPPGVGTDRLIVIAEQIKEESQ